MSAHTYTVHGTCTHLDQIAEFPPAERACEECRQMGDAWVHLRRCMICGHVGCCDDSKNKHASRHFRATGHPIMASLEAGDHWLWCFVDKALIEP